MRVAPLVDTRVPAWSTTAHGVSFAFAGADVGGSDDGLTGGEPPTGGCATLGPTVGAATEAPGGGGEASPPVGFPSKGLATAKATAATMPSASRPVATLGIQPAISGTTSRLPSRRTGATGGRGVASTWKG
jgi:hypothetical protein